MKRKLEDLAAKMAFDELEGALAEKLRQAASSDAEVERVSREYAALRSDLQRLAQRTPEPTVSTERLRDAILSSGLDRRSQPARSWSWVWAPVATGILAFVLASSRHHAAPSGPVVVKAPSADVQPLAPPVRLPAFVADNKAPTASHPNAVAIRHRHRRPSNEYAVNLMQWLPLLSPQFAGESFKANGLEAMSRRFLHDGATTATVAVASAKTPSASPNPPAASQPIVLIQPDTDGQTGAQRATEVESVANVLIGG